MLKIGVMGAGAIGCYVGGRLAADGCDVVFVGRARIREELERNGLSLTDVAKDIPSAFVSGARLRVVTEPEALADCNVVLVCVKSAQSRASGEALSSVLANTAVVVSLQNGLGNGKALSEHLGHRTVLGGIVGFNVVSKGHGVFRRATTGPIVIEAAAEPHLLELVAALRRVGFQVDVPDDIRPQQWSKLVMNLNNAVSALTDAPTQRLVFEAGYRKILVAIMSEALGIMRAAGVPLAKVGPLPAQLFPWMLRLPTSLVRAVARLQVEIDPEARSSMWEDLSRGRMTEVEYLNGEIVRLAASCGQRAPLNEKIVALVHQAEKAASGSPKMTASELWRALTE